MAYLQHGYWSKDISADPRFPWRLDSIKKQVKSWGNCQKTWDLTDPVVKNSNNATKPIKVLSGFHNSFLESGPPNFTINLGHSTGCAVFQLPVCFS